MWVSSNHGARRRQSCASSRRYGTPKTQRSLIAAAALAAGLSLSAPALAASIQSITPVGPLPEFEVASDGQFYTALDLSAPAFVLKWDIHLRSGAPVLSRVKMYGVSPRAVIFNPVIPDGVTVDLTAYGVSKFFDRPRPKEFKTTVTSDPIPYSLFQPYAVGACNMLAQQLREGGMSDSEIFGQDREVGVAISEKFTYDFTLPEGQLVGSGGLLEPNTKIICKKSPAMPSRAPVAEVQSSELQVAGLSSLIACGLALEGRIDTTKTNEEVKFRYVDGDGNTSDVKTVTSDGAKKATFEHSYVLSGNGEKSGKIRIEGVSSDFTSAWSNYAVTCNTVVGGNGGLTEDRPPLISIDVAGGKDVYHRGYACPSHARMAATLDGREQTTGNIALVAGGQLVKLKPFSIGKDEQQHFMADYYGLDWSGIEPDDGVPPQQTVEFRAELVGGSSDQKISSKTYQETFVCEPVYPKPDVTVSASETDPLIVDGYSCPSKVVVGGNLMGRGAASGNAVLYIDGAAKQGEPYNIKGSEQPVVLYVHGMRPTDYQPVAGGGRRAVLKTMLQVRNAELDLLERFEKDHSLDCIQMNAISVAPPVEVPGGQVQVVGDRVVMSGAKPNAIYSLRFFHKNQSGPFRPKTDAHLPTKAQSGVAKLNRAEMEAGQWRVDVCATRGGLGTQILPGTCRTGNFSISQNESKQKKAAYKLKVHVAGGTIRLQGAQPNAVYLLQFHHQKKPGGKFSRVKASHLPVKAVSGVAKVNLAKLMPGQWRVEVCATRGGKGTQMLPGSCIPGAFEVRRAAIGGFGGAFQ